MKSDKRFGMVSKIFAIVLALAMAVPMSAIFSTGAVAEEGNSERPPIPPEMEPNNATNDSSSVCIYDPELLISGNVMGLAGGVAGALVIAKSNQSANTTFTNEYGHYEVILNFNYSDFNGTSIEISAYKEKLGGTVSAIASWPSIVADIELADRYLPLPEPIDEPLLYYEEPIEEWLPYDTVPMPEMPDPIPSPERPNITVPSPLPPVTPVPLEEPYNITLVTMESPTGPLFEGKNRPIHVVLKNKADHNIHDIDVQIFDQLDDGEPVFLTDLFYGCIPKRNEHVIPLFPSPHPPFLVNPENDPSGLHPIPVS